MKKCLYFLVPVFLLQACGKETSNPPLPQKPTAVQLIFPYENYLCNVGTNVSPTESTVLFEWEKATNADNYNLVLKDGTTGVITSHQTSDNKIPIVLKRGTPYIWYVISKSNAVPDTAHSTTWKFWNAAAVVQSYAPFPAEIISPTMSERVSTTANEIKLEWKGSDVDNDIIGYDVYFDTTASPKKIESDLKDSFLDNIPITPNTIYYWKVITKDSKGNESGSGVFQFKIL